MSYVQLLQYDTDSELFVRGLEIGRLWERLKYEDGEVVAMVHIANAQMIMRLSDAIERPCSAEEHDETWMTVTFASK